MAADAQAATASADSPDARGVRWPRCLSSWPRACSAHRLRTILALAVPLDRCGKFDEGISLCPFPRRHRLRPGTWPVGDDGSPTRYGFSEPAWKLGSQFGICDGWRDRHPFANPPSARASLSVGHSLLVRAFRRQSLAPRKRKSHRRAFDRWCNDLRLRLESRRILSGARPRFAGVAFSQDSRFRRGHEQRHGAFPPLEPDDRTRAARAFRTNDCAR